ncbi:SDR family oxidoreductase [Candidatus Viridilinea mediisalina]|uniref:Short-chain dehydrogenase n=1 Tax=Candidatus Viridilinea mediisalina TaxID=2024553 RepID=A0A2A6RGE6_9CHLR|nr:SDR family NAD(P)-dependent oxidoreductase [Candidatus Viridilinea mediisalina]PDW01959.1 short-chain dehydrogenase [Candidatus Viridilinea mediisalina]
MTQPKTILITGASRGIGRASALALANSDVRLVLAARSSDLLAETAGAAAALGAQVSDMACDVTQEGDVRALMAHAAYEGAIDVVIHSVGAALVKPFEQISLAEWEEQLRVQLTSLFLICKYSMPHLHRGSLLINIGSIAAKQAFPGWAAYSAAKHATLGLLGSLREELRPRGIRVTSLLPAATDTSLWDNVPGEWNRGNMLQPEEIAATIVSLVNTPAHVAVEEVSIGHVVGKL